MEDLKIALAGCGRVAQTHVRNLQAIFGRSEVFVGVCDTDARRAEAMAQEAGGRPFGDIARMLEAVKPDALLLCTPPSVREVPIRLCCEAGVAFFCETPPAPDAKTCRRIYGLLARSGVVNAVGFQWRYLDLVDECRRWLVGKRVSAVVSRFASDTLFAGDLPAWLTLADRGGGPVFAETLHALDLVRYLVGNISSVMAFGSNAVVPSGPKMTVPDTLALTFSLEGGGVGSHYHGWAEKQPTAEIVIRTGFDVICLDLVGNRLTGTVDGQKLACEAGVDPWRREIETFLQAVSANDQSLIRSGYGDACETVLVASAVMESLRASILARVDSGT